MIDALRRLRYRLQLPRIYRESLARRVKVEEELLRMAKGKLPLPDAAKCAELAKRLGVPCS